MAVRSGCPVALSHDSSCAARTGLDAAGLPLDEAAEPHAARPPIRARVPIPAQILLALMLVSPSDPPRGRFRSRVLPRCYVGGANIRACDRRANDLYRAICDCIRPDNDPALDCAPQLPISPGGLARLNCTILVLAGEEGQQENNKALHRWSQIA